MGLPANIGTQFRAIDLAAYGPFEQQPSDLERIVWLLRVLEGALKLSDLSAGEIEAAMLECVRYHIPRQRIFVLLTANGRFVHCKKVGGTHRFRALGAALELVVPPRSTAASSGLIVTPETAFDGRRALQELFGSLQGSVRICDPYADPAIFDFVRRVPQTAAVRLLTAKVQQEPEFRRDLQAYLSQYGNLQIRIDDSRTLHDRYAVDDNRVIAIGTSLNGIGKRQSLIVELGPELRGAISREFERTWTTARPFS